MEFFASGGGEKVYEKFGILLEPMSQAFEPSLGPIVMKYSTSRHCEPHDSRHIIFHPRHYLAKSKATAENTPSTDDGLPTENAPVQGSINQPEAHSRTKVSGTCHCCLQYRHWFTNRRLLATERELWNECSKRSAFLTTPSI